MANVQVCPQCHKLNEAARFCDRCGRELPSMGSPANLRFLRFAVMLITILAMAYAAFGFLDTLRSTVRWDAVALFKLCTYPFGVFCVWVQRELLKLLIEVRERV